MSSKSRDAYPHLTDAQYNSLILRKTDPAGISSPATGFHPNGVYTCANCSSPLFPSSTKFASGTGWPSFYEPVAGAVKETIDWRVKEGGEWLGLKPRKEISCGKCGGHLGHVFRGEKWDVPGGARFCVNGSGLKYEGDEKSGEAEEKEGGEDVTDESVEVEVDRS